MNLPGHIWGLILLFGVLVVLGVVTLVRSIQTSLRNKRQQEEDRKSILQAAIRNYRRGGSA